MKNLNLLKIFTLSLTFILSPIFSSSSFAQQSPTKSEVIQENSKININSATAEEFSEKLNGVGLAKAKNIVEYREKYGPFITIEQLKEVSGIGQSILDKNSKILLL